LIARRHAAPHNAGPCLMWTSPRPNTCKGWTRGSITEVGSRSSEVATVDAQVLGAAEIGVETVELRDDPYAPLSLARCVRDGRAESMNLSAVRPHKAEAHAEGCRLTCTVRPDNTQAFASADFERKVDDHCVARCSA
jgi:hypothetical protein